MPERAALLRHLNEFLGPPTSGDFARIDISLRIRHRNVQQHELAAIIATPSEPTDDFTGLTVQDPNRAVHDITDENETLFGIGRERDRRYRTTHQSVVRNNEFLLEFALLVEDLNAVSAAVADVDKTVIGDLHAVHRRPIFP